MTDLDPLVEQQLADMDPWAFDALVARVRPPDEPTDPKVRATSASPRDGFSCSRPRQQGRRCCRRTQLRVEHAHRHRNYETLREKTDMG
jgi:hypothetical protein